MELVWHVDATLEGEDICHALLTNLMEARTTNATDTETSSKDQTKKELVPATGGFAETTSEKSLLEECSTDLTQQAREGDLDPVYGRDEEIQTCLQILLRRRKNNVCLIGEAGVGKTSIAEGENSIEKNLRFDIVLILSHLELV